MEKATGVENRGHILDFSSPVPCKTMLGMTEMSEWIEHVQSRTQPRIGRLEVEHVMVKKDTGKI